MVSAPGVGVVPEHSVLGGPEVTANAEADHEADVGEDGQLPPLPAATTGGVLDDLEDLVRMDGGPLVVGVGRVLLVPESGRMRQRPPPLHKPILLGEPGRGAICPVGVLCQQPEAVPIIVNYIPPRTSQTIEDSQKLSRTERGREQGARHVHSNE